MVPSDKLESNSDIVKAELSFYSTPHIRDYEALFAACSSWLMIAAARTTSFFRLIILHFELFVHSCSGG